MPSVERVFLTSNSIFFFFNSHESYWGFLFLLESILVIGIFLNLYFQIYRHTYKIQVISPFNTGHGI